jgi:protein-L-isoaspartate(D-aspartate) O-methyltransferase
MTEYDFSLMRSAMVASQLRPNGVTDIDVIKAFETVNRDRFVPSERRTLAYVDVSIPCESGRSINAPLPTARLLNEAGLRGGEKVLLIGAATGYAAALLSELNADVTAVEEDSALFAQLQSNVSELPKIKPVQNALKDGAADPLPYDVIIIDGAVERITDALKAQVKDGGLVVAGMIDQGVTRLCAGYRVGNSLAMQPFLDIGVVPLPGFAPEAAFQF